MIPITQRTQRCQVFHYINRVRTFQYEADIYGFGMEGDGDQTTCVAIVRKPNGDIDTLSANCITLLPPPMDDGTTAGAR